jgi:hypothetical protein
MKAAFQVKPLAVGALILCSAMGSAALTLGRAQGAVFVGKPLDFRIQLELDGNEAALSGCMSADVFYGDTQLDPTRVKATVEPAGASRGPAVRVQSSVLIDEPVVTVNLGAGCPPTLSKRYTLFPDVSTNVVEPLVAAPARRVPAPVALPVVLSPAQPAVADAPRKARAVNAAVASVAVLPPDASTAAMAVPSRPRSVKAPGKARLKLDPLDLRIDYDPVLKASSEMLSMPQENSPQRAEAAALWRALNSSPEEILREDAQALRIQENMKSLIAATTENQKGLMELTARLERTQSERYANWLVYSLVALCLAALLALAWVWRRLYTARPPSWLHGLDGGDSLMAELVQAPPVSLREPAIVPKQNPAVVPAVVGAQAPIPPPAALTEVDFDLDFMGHPLDEPLSPEPLVAGAIVPTPLPVPVPEAADRDFMVSAAAGLRAIDSEELLDVRQQADFFMSLGEHQKAIDILTTRIAQCGESIPLVCLDLLKIYHALGREADFEFMRTEFNHWFTGRVPAFPAFSDEGRALDHYPQVMDLIVALWPDSRVLEYIENCIYHHSNDDGVPDFDLQAYRELLLLHGVAKRIARLSGEAGDSYPSELMRIPPRAALPLGEASEAAYHAALVHRAGVQHRGAWTRNVTKGQDADPQEDLVTPGSHLGAMKVPPVAPIAQAPDEQPHSVDGGPPRGPASDFDFLNLR